MDFDNFRFEYGDMEEEFIIKNACKKKEQGVLS